MLFVGGAAKFATTSENEAEALSAHMEELKTALNTLVQTSHEKAAAEHKLITDITDPAMRNAVLEWRKKA